MIFQKETSEQKASWEDLSSELKTTHLQLAILTRFIFVDINFREIDFCVGLFIVVVRYVMCVIAAGKKQMFAKSLKMY